MGKTYNSKLAHGTYGSPQSTLDQQKYKIKVIEIIKKEKKPIFDEKGHVTLESISSRREFFLRKSVHKIERILKKAGYETTIRPSKHSTSKAKIIIIANSSSERNITQVQVSPKSKRHGVPYVKISTNDMKKIKIINSTKNEYKTDGKETAILLFNRYKYE